MKPKIAETVPHRVWEVYRQICQVIEDMPEYVETPEYNFGYRIQGATAKLIPSCHQITRALSSFFPVEVHDGCVTNLGKDGENHILEHSWLSVDNEDKLFIVDPWPLGAVSGPAIFIQGQPCYFQIGKNLTSFNGDSFLREVESTKEVVRSTIEKLFPELLT